ncbi:MAG: NAD(P)-dependent oxidoreductase [Myxococcota bacterium]
MRIGVPKETFPGEGRVAAAPSAARALAQAGHVVIVEQGAGAASGLGDDEYIRAGAEIAPTAEEVFDRAELVWKVMPLSAHEARLAKQRVLDFPALAADDTVRAAMSEIAGRLAVEAASHALQRQNGGRGLLLGGVPGVEAASVVVVGAGVAGRGAAALAAAMGAVVRVLDVDVARLRGLAGVQTLVATPHTVERALALADVVIAAVRSPDGSVPRVATRAHLALMQPGAVVVDLAGGAFESTPPTTLDAPAEEVDGIVHIGVPNFPGAVPRTASVALSQASLPRVLAALAG